MTEQSDVSLVWDAIEKQRIAMLTIEEDGRLNSRPMAALSRREEGKIYFVTRLDSKVGEIGGSAPVNVAFSDEHKNTYVSITGTARTSQTARSCANSGRCSRKPGCRRGRTRKMWR
jgi:general stress protein 26